MADNNAPLPAIPAADAAAFDVVAFDGRRRLQEIHELLTSYLDYQSHSTIARRNGVTTHHPAPKRRSTPRNRQSPYGGERRFPNLAGIDGND